jgi:hypothetical protein
MQHRTFGSHRVVRRFFAVTENNDTDRSCSQQLSTAQITHIAQFCKNSTARNNAATLLMKDKFRPKREPGWLCAQKRPVEGLAQLLFQYRQGLEIPPYVLIIDDDTYLPNMDALGIHLLAKYPPNVPSILGSCFVTGTSKFLIPFGGFGTILSRGAILNLLEPIDCSIGATNAAITTRVDLGRDGRRSQLCCEQLSVNLLGEAYFFRANMSVADLMYAYSAQQPYTTAANDHDTGWRPDLGFCMHSDHALAYFINMYYIGLPASQRAVKRPDPAEPLKTRHGYTRLVEKQCDNQHGHCNSHNLFCHYITPKHMESLHRRAT